MNSSIFAFVFLFGLIVSCHSTFPLKRLSQIPSEGDSSWVGGKVVGNSNPFTAFSLTFNCPQYPESETDDPDTFLFVAVELTQEPSRLYGVECQLLWTYEYGWNASVYSFNQYGTLLSNYVTAKTQDLITCELILSDDTKTWVTTITVNGVPATLNVVASSIGESFNNAEVFVGGSNMESCDDLPAGGALALRDIYIETSGIPYNPLWAGDYVQSQCSETFTGKGDQILFTWEN